MYDSFTNIDNHNTFVDLIFLRGKYDNARIMRSAVIQSVVFHVRVYAITDGCVIPLINSNSKFLSLFLDHMEMYAKIDAPNL